MEVQDANGIERAAILLMSLGVDEAAKVLKHLGPKEVQQLGQAMAQLKDVNKPKVESVVRDFIVNIQNQTHFGIDNDTQVRELLIHALGEDKARGMIDKILVSNSAKGLDTLKWMDPKIVADFIKHEHPRVQAIILSYLEPEQSGKIIAHLDEKARLDIVMRISQQDTIYPDALEELNKVIEEQFKTHVVSQEKPLGGVKRVADILNNIDPAIENTLFDKIKQSDPVIADAISDLMLVFDNLKELDGKGMQALLREISTDTLVLALKGSDPEMKDKIFSNMSKRASELLKDDLEAKGPVRVKEVEAAQKEILIIAKRMSEEGKISLGKNGEEMI